MSAVEGQMKQMMLMMKTMIKMMSPEDKKMFLALWTVFTKEIIEELKK